MRHILVQDLTFLFISSSLDTSTTLLLLLGTLAAVFWSVAFFCIVRESAVVEPRKGFPFFCKGPDNKSFWLFEPWTLLQLLNSALVLWKVWLSSNNKQQSWVQWHLLVNQLLRRLRHKDHKFKAGLGNLVTLSQSNNESGWECSLVIKHSWVQSPIVRKQINKQTKKSS